MLVLLKRDYSNYSFNAAATQGELQITNIKRMLTISCVQQVKKETNLLQNTWQNN